MQVGKFEKVSFEQFYEALKGCVNMDSIGADKFDAYAEEAYNNIELPTRATSGSAGYDFKAPFTFGVPVGKSRKIPTGIRAKIDEGWWLGCLPRSSLGFKYRLQLDNTLGVVDSDYYYSDNEGHIFIKVTNDSKKDVGDKRLVVNAGDRFVQAIFLPYGITYNDRASDIRNGGIGSTNRK